MAFTTEHYEGMADFLGMYINNHCVCERDVRNMADLTDRMAAYFHDDNHRFVRQTFIGRVTRMLNEEIRLVFVTTEL